MHDCKICGTEVSFSILFSVCGICARKIRTALNRHEDYQAAGCYLKKEPPDERGYELQPLFLLPEIE